MTFFYLQYGLKSRYETLKQMLILAIATKHCVNRNGVRLIYGKRHAYSYG